jgi:hypothetical protein
LKKLIEFLERRKTRTFENPSLVLSRHLLMLIILLIIKFKKTVEGMRGTSTLIASFQRGAI